MKLNAGIITEKLAESKAFYTQMICKEWRQHFPVVLSYNRFVEREQMVSLKLYLFLNNCCLSDCTGISIIDSTPIWVCHDKRSRRHKTFRGFATSGKGTMGWFFGFKLHIIINDRGEIVQWQLTPANTDDRTPLKNKKFTCYDGVQEQILDGQYVKETVVVDGHLTTSRGPSTALAFAYELVEQLGGDAESLRTGMLYRDVFGKNQ